MIRGRIGFMLRAIHILTFGGGTNEMQRDLIALFGLEHAGDAAILGLRPASFLWTAPRWIARGFQVRQACIGVDS